MRINYYYSTSAIIIFNDEFELKIDDSLDNIVCKIEWAFREYDFTKAEVIDSKTGELLVTVDDDNFSDEEEDEDFEPDYDECGFNPYMGCYDYDC